MPSPHRSAPPLCSTRSPPRSTSGRACTSSARSAWSWSAPRSRGRSGCWTSASGPLNASVTSRRRTPQASAPRRRRHRQHLHGGALPTEESVLTGREHAGGQAVLKQDAAIIKANRERLRQSHGAHQRNETKRNENKGGGGPRRASGGGCRRRARATTSAPNLDHNHGTIGVEFGCGPRGCGRRLLAVAGDDDDAVDGTRLHPGDRGLWVSGAG